jgi:hypothetical protein
MILNYFIPSLLHCYRFSPLIKISAFNAKRILLALCLVEILNQQDLLFYLIDVINVLPAKQINKLVTET